MMTGTHILRIVAVLCFLSFFSPVKAQATDRTILDSLCVLGDSIGGIRPGDMMKTYLHRQADLAWKNWKAGYEDRTDETQVRNHYIDLREKFIQAIGGLPHRTPLNAQVTRVLRRDAFTVENVIFESRPKHFVTANLYLPKSAAFKHPYPAVLVPCGHNKNSKTHDDYQSMGALLAINGMVALVYDPVGQGERLQICDDDGEFGIWGTRSHILDDIPAILLGTSVAQNMIWDGMRALDYLVSRPEVDPDRIGCTGNSGGGTQTVYLTALDERIKVSAPSCYIHHLNSQIKKSMGDAEQNIFGQLQFGMDHPDYLMMRAPTSIMILAATRDFFDINAVWETYRYAKRYYSRLGYADHMDIFENDAPHNYNHDQRVAGLKWMARWLQNRTEGIFETEPKLFSEEELQCTPEGQTLLMPGALSVRDLQSEMSRDYSGKKKDFLKTHTDAEFRAGIRACSGIKPFGEIPVPDFETVESMDLRGYSVEKLIIKPEPGIWLPALYFKPGKDHPHKIILFLNEEGKAFSVSEIRQHVEQGNAVLAVDLRGTGETRQKGQEGKGAMIGLDWEDGYTAYLLGKSFVAMRTEDVYACVKFLQNLGVSHPVAIGIQASGNVGIPALHAAALEPELFQSVQIRQCLRSWADIIASPRSYNQLTSIVRGALAVYDLPDLVSLLQDKVSVENPTNALGFPVDGKTVAENRSREPVLSGLAGIWYGSADLQDPVGADPVATLQLTWGTDSRRGRTWSAHWFGWFRAPASGTVMFEVACEQSAVVSVSEQVAIKVVNGKVLQSDPVKIQKGSFYPISVIYNQRESAEGFLTIKWRSGVKTAEKIPKSALYHSPVQHAEMKFSWR